MCNAKKCVAPRGAHLPEANVLNLANSEVEMAKRIIRLEGDEILRKKSKPVKKITDSILTLLDDMKETMDAAEGVGIAAVQVGSLRRIVLIDVGEGLIEMLNPEITDTEGEQSGKEACLSVPDYSAHVDRPMSVKVTYYDRDMKEQSLSAEGYLAVAVCHELDHLDGVLFTDKCYELEEEPDEDEEEPEK